MSKFSMKLTDEQDAIIAAEVARLNAHPSRSTPIASNDEYLVIEIGHLIRCAKKNVAQEKATAAAQAILDEAAT